MAKEMWLTHNMADIASTVSNPQHAWRSRIVRHGEESPDQLNANPRNWRIHPKQQQDALAGLLDQVGWVQDVIVNERTGHIVDGHLRVSLAISRGESSIPVVYVDLSEDEEALVLASIDPLAGMAVTDAEQLAALLDAVSVDDAALRAMLDSLIVAPSLDGLTDPDDVPEDVEPVTKPGDLWVLGGHRLLCGDATIAADVERLLDGEKPFLMVTDPPYGVEYDAAWRDDLSDADRRKGKVNNDDRADWSPAWALSPATVAYCWSAARSLQIASGLALMQSGFEIRGQMIWRKSHFPIGRGHYTDRHEPCWYAVREGQTAKWKGDRSESTIWEASLDPTEGKHSTQKPVEVMERPIRNHGGKSDHVYDPFVGSGTTIIAAERQGRRCFAMEIDPVYVDTAVLRWENFTGQKAVKHGA
jgi:DNA modification methylase